MSPAIEPPSNSAPLFHLGTHEPSWLARVDVPLFVSHRRLCRRPYRLPRASTPWALDSGAFSEIAMFGRFTTTPTEYIAAVRSYRDEVGSLMWAAPQDHMCEPFVLARSEIADTVDDAQRWTVDNLLTLRTLDAALPIVPVLQGLTLDDYRRHADMYDRAGINLRRERLVGLGSVCRRQATTEIAELVAALHGDGIRLHGFGIKTSGFRRYGWCLTSADSLAWSYRGRRINPCPHTGAMSCANCLPHALAWRAQVVDERRPVQMGLAL
jgi:hypothetical protein